MPIECVARGYLAGSGWKEYTRTGAVCGIALPPGLQESDRLPEPIFTPATKAESGHDENISAATRSLAGRLLTPWRSSNASRWPCTQRASAHAEARGIILADTKFEFGWTGRPGDSDLMLIDEAVTPDSSRFWPKDGYRPGGAQASYDKQFVRDYLEAIRWDKQPPVPTLPDDVVQRTREKYLEAFRLLTGQELQ